MYLVRVVVRGLQKSSAKRLGQPCKPRTRGGGDALRRLAKGLPPKKTVQWPLPAGASALGTAAAAPRYRLTAKTAPAVAVNAAPAALSPGRVQAGFDDPEGSGDEPVDELP